MGTTKCHTCQVAKYGGHQGAGNIVGFVADMLQLELPRLFFSWGMMLLLVLAVTMYRCAFL